jgi:stage III sporulation protein AD
MGEYLRFAAVVLIGLILALVVGRQSKDMSLLLTLAVCVLVCIAAMGFLEPVTELLRELRRLGNLDSGAVAIALKCAGIGLISELIGLLCADAGQSAMGKALELLSAAAILWLSLPLIREILNLIEGVLST